MAPAVKGFFSFAIVSLAGYLFFLFIPVELAFIYYLTAGENFILLNAVALGTALFAEHRLSDWLFL